MEKFKQMLESKEFRYALNIDGPSKDGSYKSKDFENFAKKIPGYVSLRHSKPRVKGMITIKAKDYEDGYDTLRDYFNTSNKWDVEISTTE